MGYKIRALHGKVSQKNLGFWYTVCKGKKPRNSKEKLSTRESKKLSKKTSFLRVVSKITIFACVFCTLSAWSDTTTCDIDFTPITGNSWQNGTPTPENPVEVISVGDRTVNLFDETKIENASQAGITLTKITDGFTLSGTATGYTTFNTYFDEPISKAGEPIYLSYLASGSYTGAYGFRIRNKTSGEYIVASNNRSYTPTFDVDFIQVYTANTGTYDVTITNIQIVKGSTPTSYVPYGYQIPVVGTSTNGSRTTTSVYLNDPLRKVGDYADVLDYKNGQIIRNVGVSVLDGTESWTKSSSLYQTGLTNYKQSTKVGLVTHFKVVSGTTGDGAYFGIRFTVVDSSQKWATLEDFEAFLAQQYAAGTPVTVYYPLATPVVEQIENWSCIPPITDIKIATTKMVDEEFAAAEANLAATVQTIESVVSRTITQTEQIATLQAEKQTRPDETCPANMKCLLVQDEDGTPHWYPIIEP
ncbi:MAG: hypothetical protein MJ164_02495 [Alphaproteobacteria bacterium]|nr:hypothetical protein [Alphaproteobacteria bacterium]